MYEMNEYTNWNCIMSNTQWVIGSDLRQRLRQRLWKIHRQYFNTGYLLQDNFLYTRIDVAIRKNTYIYEMKNTMYMELYE